jgi:hypothetical protein
MISVGIEPLNCDSSTTISVSLIIFPISFGIVPDNLHFNIDKKVREIKLPISVGRDPVNGQLWSEIYLSVVIFPISVNNLVSTKRRPLRENKYSISFGK